MSILKELNIDVCKALDIPVKYRVNSHNETVEDFSLVDLLYKVKRTFHLDQQPHSSTLIKESKKYLPDFCNLVNREKLRDYILEIFGNLSVEIDEDSDEFIIQVIDKGTIYRHDCGCGCGGYYDEYYFGRGKYYTEALLNLTLEISEQLVNDIDDFYVKLVYDLEVGEQ